MAHYFLSFRIADKTVNGKSYAERRQGMIDAVVTKGHGFWDGTTSLIMVESPLDTYSFAARAGASLSKNDDMLIVFDPSDLSMAYIGAVGDEEVLKSFFRISKKI